MPLTGSDVNTFAVQYLEDGPGVAEIDPRDARARLRAAFARLPISHVLLGWNLPSAVVEACRQETARAGARLFRWHPLLTGDSTFVPLPEWQTVGLDGEPVPGFRGLPEFTFVCPNRPAVREAVGHHLHDVVRRGGYNGVFLDRVRYPSPAADPARLLACFCDDCRRVAASEGLDLEAVRQRIRALLAQPERAPGFIQALLGAPSPNSPDPDLAPLRAFLDFRARSVTRFVEAVAGQVRAEGLAVGLDCFSPALAHMVGQDLGALAGCCDWIKVMIYGHAFGPAGLPFELMDLVDWLIATGGGRRDGTTGVAFARDAAAPPTKPCRAAPARAGAGGTGRRGAARTGGGRQPSACRHRAGRDRGRGAARSGADPGRPARLPPGGRGWIGALVGPVAHSA